MSRNIYISKENKVLYYMEPSDVEFRNNLYDEPNYILEDEVVRVTNSIFKCPINGHRAFLAKSPCNVHYKIYSEDYSVRKATPQEIEFALR